MTRGTDGGPTDATGTDDADDVAAAMQAAGGPSGAEDALARVRERMGFAELPRTIGDYRVERRLGEGAMGVVYLAHDARLGRKVAIKVLSSPRPSPRKAERLVREARGLARLSHPNVLTVYEADRHGDAVYLVTEYAPGGDLATYLAERRPGPSEILRLFEDAARGLAAAHDAGLVHRDFKPANVLLDAHGRAKVADFGLVRSLDDSTSLSSDDDPADAGAGAGTDGSSANLTRTGALVGTPAYMAPEVLDGAPADPRSDQFSFCVALYEAIAGVRPFAGNTVQALVEAIETQQLRPPREGRSIPRWLLRILRRGLARDPARRFADMHALARALARGSRGRRAAAVAGLLGAGAVAGIAAVFAAREPPCTQGPAEIAAIWNDGQRARLRAAFEAAALPYGAPLLESVTGALDRYAATWAGAHRRACEDTRVHGTSSEAVLDLRMHCLDERRRALAEVVDVLSRAEGGALGRAYDAVARLPAVETCDDVAWLQKEEPLPDDPVQRAEVRALSSELTALVTTFHMLQPAEAQEKVEALAPRIEETDWPPLSARLDLLRAQTLIERGMPQDADALLRRAFATALRSGDDETATLAASTGIHLAGTQLQDQEAAQTWWWIAEPLAERLGANRKPMGLLLANRANALLMAGEYEPSVATRLRAIEILSDLLGPDAPLIAEQRVNLAATYRRLGNPERAVSEILRAVETLQRTYGPLHPKLGRAYNNLGMAQVDLGRLDDAQASYATSLEIKQATLRPGHPSLGNAYSNLAEVFLEKGEFDDARPSAERALEIWRKALGPNHPLTLSAIALRARIETRAGHPDRAAEILRSALEDRIAEGGVPAAELAWELAKLLDDPLGERDAALARARYARGAFREAGRTEDADQVDAWLRERARPGPPAAGG